MEKVYANKELRQKEKQDDIQKILNRVAKQEKAFQKAKMKKAEAKNDKQEKLQAKTQLV